MTLLFKLGTGNILIGISILVKGVQLVLKVEEKVTRISVLADVSHIQKHTYRSVHTETYIQKHTYTSKIYHVEIFEQHKFNLKNTPIKLLKITFAHIRIFF